MAKRKASKKSNFHLQFLFPGEDKMMYSSDYLSGFAEKIKTEQSSHASICVLSDTIPSEEADHRLISYSSLKKASSQEVIRDGYVVIFESRFIKGQINPGEFFQLPLPEDSTRKHCYDFYFKGKKGISRGGLIVPSDVMRYVLAIHGSESFPNPEIIRLILKKLEFTSEKMEVQQDPPFDDSRKTPSLFKDRLRLNLAWNTSLPLKEARSPTLKSFFFTREHPLFRLAFFATALAIFLIIPILSQDAGLSGDDEKHYQHAGKVFRYYTEDDPASLNDPKHKLNFYGQSFDFFTYLFVRLFGLEEHAYEARHAMVALTGAAAILFTALLVKLFAGYSGGFLALILMFLSPRFLGHAFNNPMDIPFALGNIFTLYHIILFLKKLPRLSLRSAIWIAVGIGWTNGIRIGGLLLIPYLFMIAGLYLLIHKWPWKFFSAGWWKFALRGMGTLLVISIAGYLLSLLTWPYALQDIINHPIKAFQTMSDIQVSIRVLYDGIIHWSDNLPWHYIPKNVMFTVPLIILFGWLASSVTWFLDRKEGNGIWYFLLWFTILFPVIFIIFRESNVYGGWRHMMFIYPSMLALSAIAISSLIRHISGYHIRYAAILVLAVGLFHPAKHILTNHPNTYIYFNELSGGINKTAGRFETDYYTNSIKPASVFFLDSILPQWEHKSDKPVQVVSNSNIQYYFREMRDGVKTLYSRYYDLGKYDWDYAILYCNYIHPFHLKNGMWPPKNTIHEIRVDDVVIAAIVERQNRDDYLGSTLLYEAMNERNPDKLDQALHYLESAVQYDTTNVIAHLELANTYSTFLQFTDARETMDHLLEIYPNYDKALNLKGYTYLLEAEVSKDERLIEDAISFINQAIKSNYKFYSGYYNLGHCYGLKNDKANSEYNLKQAIRYNSKFKKAYIKLAELYEQNGENDLARQVRERASKLP